MLKKFGLPRLIILIFLISTYIIAPFVGIPITTALSDTIIRFGMNAILFFIFLYLNDGAEVIILILNGIIALLSFMLTTSAIPVGYYVNSGMIELVEIREG